MFQASGWLNRRIILFCSVAILATVCGCGKSPEPWEIVHPARGTVTYKGKPIAGAELSFFPQDSTYPDSVRPRAKSADDGSFVVWTYAEGDGAPAGKYKVTIVHHEVSISKEAVVAKPNDLPAKYSRLDSTDLEVSIGETETEIPPLELH
ncbi:MAG: hypothetical protein JNL58_27740 [Planctomyces sp.]|nr:hypothetical protein [Planctomyces sp.]